jgi:hypothetical protein
MDVLEECIDCTAWLAVLESAYMEIILHGWLYWKSAYREIVLHGWLYWKRAYRKIALGREIFGFTKCTA